jgi:hypothetical protein
MPRWAARYFCAVCYRVSYFPAVSAHAQELGYRHGGSGLRGDTLAAYKRALPEIGWCLREEAAIYRQSHGRALEPFHSPTYRWIRDSSTVHNLHPLPEAQ